MQKCKMSGSIRLILMAVFLTWTCFDQANANAFIDLDGFISVNEGDDPLSICVSLTTAQDGTVSVSTSPLSPTITSGDFDALANVPLDFTSDGATTQCVDFVFHADNVVETAELVQVQLSSSSITLDSSRSSILITILDNSRIDVTFTETSYTTADEDGAINVCAEIVSGSIERSVSINFESKDIGTASSMQDYIPVAVTSRSFSPTAPTSPQCTPVTVLTDTIIEEDETLTISLTPGGEAVNIITDTATVVITDNDGVNFALASSLVSIAEGNSGLTNVSVGITVSWPSGYTLDRDVVLLGTTSDSSATAANNDYVVLVDKQLVIPSTATSGSQYTFIAQVTGDVVQENSELFFINFSGENNNDVFPGSPRVRIQIQDDGDVIQDCGTLSSPSNGQVAIDPDTLQDSVATYSCVEGYDLNGVETRTCTSAGSWDGTDPTCEIVNCGAPPIPTNGDTTVQSTNYQGQTIYGCVTGYELSTGDPTITRVCQLDGTWSGADPECVRVDCGFVPNLVNGIITYPDGVTTYEARVQYECEAGYNLQGTNERLCLSSVTWSSSAPTCEPVNCGELNAPENGAVDVPMTVFPEVATYSCNMNFELVNGPQTRMCQTDATWSENAPTCQVIQCPTLTNPSNGEVTIDVTLTGDTTATYSCDEGYNQVGASTRNCQENAQWSGTEPTCQIVQCPSLSDPANGQVDVSSNDYLSTANYTCSVGYNLVGAASTTCQSSGQWNNQPPTCTIVTCGALSSPGNGSLTLNNNTFNSEASYSCNSQYMINGPQVRTCQESGMWSGEVPTCEEIVCPTIAVADGNVNKTDGNRIDSVATIQCEQGLDLVGTSPLTCLESGEWSETPPTCEVIQCPALTVTNGNISLTNGTMPGSVATVTCDGNFEFSGSDSRTCLENGTWSGEGNNCSPVPGPTAPLITTLATTTIVGIAVGGVVALIILITIISVAIICCCIIRRKKIYKKYVLPYRSYIYANSQRNSSGPMTDAEIRQWESESRQHAVDAVDALEKPDLAVLDS